MRGSSRVLFENLCLEFETAWDAMATTHRELRTGGSFLFARQAMLLVELATTVARTDADTLQRFSEELLHVSPRCSTSSRTRPGRAPATMSRA
jgi:hypothetical protein